jgi:hypothetical protein
MLSEVAAFQTPYEAAGIQGFLIISVDLISLISQGNRDHIDGIT